MTQNVVVDPRVGQLRRLTQRLALALLRALEVRLMAHNVKGLLVDQL
eukprot:CAMPEP_0205929896 /NCGR_PEP_ID=MMETSP1325-20131115/25571_1 /ASSEMBLY_ACC=CAM_ASM_000708 /TAXON_ID=236786 /ORGANISM="Florenciella sp., Strain RCC1007" /LENGTH=46 /DNA_ID= /DNA_START= /DNA_END= /DNA_ORIENTATION=